MNPTLIRQTKEYQALRDEVIKAADSYWSSFDQRASCEKIIITSFRLLRYMTRHLDCVYFGISDDKIKNHVGEVVTQVYTIKNKTPINEMEFLEALSRTAFRQMKKVKR